jgi:hypothetical protein
VCNCASDSRSVTAADVNGDGLVDVLVANWMQPNQVFLSTGAGEHTLDTESAIAVNFTGTWEGSTYFGGDKSTDIIAVDVNGDGHADVLVTNSGQPNQVFLGDGKGAFTLNASSPIAANLKDKSSSITTADFNGDGHMDVLIGNVGHWSTAGTQKAKNKLFMGDGKGDFTLITDGSIAINRQNTYSVTAADVNGDSHMDVLVGNYKGPNQLFLGDGKGTFALDVSSPIDFGEYRNTYSITAADVNGDDHMDVLVANYDHDNQVFLGNGAGALALDMSSPIVVGSGKSERITVADINGDRHVDVLVAQDGSNQVFLAEKPGGVLALDTSSLFAVGSNRERGLAVADVNGDGHVDVLVVNTVYKTIRRPNQVLLGDGKGVFTLDAASPMSDDVNAADSHGIAAADVNGDGHADVFVANDGPNQVFLSNGAGTLVLNASSPIANYDSESNSITVADVNGDGHADVLVGNKGPNQVFLGDGRGGVYLGRVIANCWR